MNRVTRWISAAFACVVATTVVPAPALARTSTKVEWSSVRMPEGKDADKKTRVLKTLLTQAARKADFGKAKSVKLSARVTEFSSVKKGDVLQVSCTIVGRLAGGPSARSRISFGGSPTERDQLEKQVLSMVANGLVARLAEIARAKAAREERQERKEKEEDLGEGG
jgi:hypothetical protein